MLKCVHCWVLNWLSDFLVLAHRDSCVGLLRCEKPFAPLGQHSFVPLPFLCPDIEISFGIAIIKRVAPILGADRSLPLAAPFPPLFLPVVG